MQPKRPIKRHKTIDKRKDLENMIKDIYSVGSCIYIYIYIYIYNIYISNVSTWVSTEEYLYDKL